MAGALLLAISLSVDAFGIGVSYGVRKIRIPLDARLIIMAISILITGVSVLFGSLVSNLLPLWAAKFIGIFILMIMGLWIIFQSFKEERQKMDHKAVTEEKEKTIFNILIKSLGITIKIMRTPQWGDLDRNNCIEKGEALYIGTALSIDSVGIGIASAAIGLNTLLVPLFTGLCQIVFLTAGFSGGSRLSGLNGNSRLWMRLSGVILIFISLIRIF